MSFTRLEQFLRGAIGLDGESLGKESVRHAAMRRMAKNGIDDLGRYCELLESSRGEASELIEQIVVPETWFFRDRAPFSVVAEYCRSLFAESGRGVLRILSAPCATGEEPYSIAIALLAAGIPGRAIAVDAVDISAAALAKAKLAVYSPNSFRFGSDLIQPRYFQTTGNGMAVDETVKNCVTFSQGNLLEAGFAAGCYDAVFCRNLLIYLTSEARRRVIDNLLRLLAEGGLLFCGHTEVMILKAAGLTPLPDTRSFACRKGGASTVLARPAKTSAQHQRLNVVHAESNGVLPPELPPSQDAPAALKSAVDLCSEPPIQPPAKTELQRIQELADRGDLEHAAAQCRRTIAEQGPSADLFCLLAEITLAGQAPEAARDLLQKALYLDPRHYLSLMHMTLLCRQSGRLEEAERYRGRLTRLETGVQQP